MKISSEALEGHASSDAGLNVRGDTELKKGTKK
jgi:hypothetical protein